MDLQKIGACLRDLRKEKGLTLEQLAEQFHVSQRTVSRWEAGSNMPDIEVLLALADFYEVDLRSLLNGERVNLKMTQETKETVQEVVKYSKNGAYMRKLWAQNLLIWCCPAIVLISVFLCIPNSYTVLGKIICCCLLLFFGLIVTRLILLFRSQRTVREKVWRCIIWSIILITLLLFSLFFFSLGTNYRSTKINAKQRFEAEVERVLPDAISTPLELDSPESVVLHKYLINYIAFSTKADILLCQYVDTAYENAKTMLENRYSFRTELLENRYADDPEKKLLEPYIEIGDDHFHILYPNDGDDQAWEFYKRSIWVVTNDAEQEIGYILFNDIDLDYVEDLTEFINEFCGWKYVRN